MDSFIWIVIGVIVAVAIVVVAVLLLQRSDKKAAEQKAAAERELQAQQERARQAQAQLAAENQRRYEEAKRQREAYIAHRQAQFIAELEAIPTVPIKLSTERYSRRPVRDIPEVKFAGITKRTNPLSFASFVVVDVETTGLKMTSKIVELSAIRFEGQEPVEKFSTLINPEIHIPEEASRINKITDEMVADAPQIWEVMPAFREFVGSLPIVGHNLPFDLEFLYMFGFDLLDPPRKYFDTLQIAKTCLRKPRNDEDFEYDVYDYSLLSLCEHYNIAIVGSHRSAADCLATGRVFNELVKQKMYH